jgi:protein-disulfide isomerase
MTVYLLRIGALLLLAAALLAPGAGTAAEALSPEQKLAVEQVIHDYLMKHPDLLLDVLKEGEAKAKQDKEDGARQTIAAKRSELVADASTPVGGNPQGDVTIVEFFDYRCPYCKQVEPSIEALIKEDPKLRVVYKEFPILGPESIYASRMALAARKQGKYAAFHNAMMAVKGQISEDIILETARNAGVDLAQAKVDMSGADVRDILKRNYALAEALDIQGTPTFIIGDELMPNAVDLAGLRKLVALARHPG